MPTSRRNASIMCVLVTFVGGFGAGFAFPQCGQVFAPKATVPPHAGHEVTVASGFVASGTGAFDCLAGGCAGTALLSTVLVLVDGAKYFSKMIPHPGHSLGGSVSVGFRL